MRIPDYLTNEHSRLYWKRHAKRVRPEDVDNFALLCHLWGLLQTCDSEKDSKEATRFAGLCKQYMSYHKLVFPAKKKTTEETPATLFPITRPPAANAG